MTTAIILETRFCHSVPAIVPSSTKVKSTKYFSQNMPHLRIETNVPRNKIPQDFVTKTIPVLAKTLGKPEQYCVVSVIPDSLMSFSGTSEPCAIANLMSIGALGVEANKKHAKVLFDLVEKELGVPKNRMYISFHDEPTSNVGFNGTTFHDLFG